MSPAAASAWSSAGEALSRWAILCVLAVLYLVAIALSDAFLEPVYVGNILRQAAPVGIAAIGTTLVMILGCIDLSIGAIISFSAVLCARADGRRRAQRAAGGGRDARGRRRPRARSTACWWCSTGPRRSS